MKSLSILLNTLKPIKQKKVLFSKNIFGKETTKLASITKIALLGKLVKKQLKSPWFLLGTAAALPSKDPKAVAYAAINNAGIGLVNHNNIQTAKEIGPFRDYKEIKSLKNQNHVE